MVYSKILLGILFGLIGQVGTFLQLQVSYKYGWYEKYPWIIVLASVPLGWLYIQSVNNFIQGFGVGVIVFTTLSHYIFKEPLDLKNGICLILGFTIVLVQLFLK